MLLIDNARVMTNVLKARGLRIVSGRTDCHMFLVDLQAKNLTGKQAEEALGRANITVNKNAKKTILKSTQTKDTNHAARWFRRRRATFPF